MLYDKNVRDGQRRAAKEYPYGWTAQRYSSDTQTTAWPVAKGEWKAQWENEHIWHSLFREKHKCSSCPAIFPAIHVFQTCQITWIHPVLT